MDEIEPSPRSCPDLTLQATNGAQYTLSGGRDAMVGRAAESDVCLLHEGVSRRHATMVPRHGQWFLSDLGSARGTYLNGVRLEREVPTPVAGGDLVVFGPAAFRAWIGGAAPSTVVTVEEGSATGQRIERLGGTPMPGAARRLRLLTECIARLQSAPDEEKLAREALGSALKGSGYSRGAILRPLAEGREVTVLVSRRTNESDTTEFRFSRALILAAAAGEPAVLSRDSPQVQSHSIAEMGIHSAMCVPVKLGEAMAGYLYLDARGAESLVQQDAAGYCEAVATAYGLALSNFKRAELERRQREIAEDLAAAHEAQRFMLPPVENDLGFLRYAMEMKPGVFVAGDLFDVIPLDQDRVAVFIGDVAGHGVGAAMVMALVQSHLNAVLANTRDPAVAVAGVNRFLTTRSFGGRFVSLWLGVFERGGLLRFVDAGHGYSLVRPCGERSRVRPCVSQSGIPMGIDPDYEYVDEELTLAPGDRVVLFTDGMIEQRASAGEEFGAERMAEVVAGSGSVAEDVGRLFAALGSFAGARTLDDDATAASLEYRGPRA